jgi:tetratricopeptide (TPR) repeat protein
MATATDKAIIHYEQTAKKIAASQHVDFVELRQATKYAGRNVSREISNSVNDLWDKLDTTITYHNQKFQRQLEHMSGQMQALINIQLAGFQLTIAYLEAIYGRLDDITQILSEPLATLGAELRRRGIFLLTVERRDRAVANLKQALAHNECDYISLYTLAWIYAEDEQFILAAMRFEDTATYAKDNAALAAEAALLSASCYRKCDNTEKAWQVLHDALWTGCPDLTLALVKYANSEGELEFSIKLLATAFVIDAELVIAAETMELEHIEEAVKVAYAELVQEILNLKRSWGEMYETSKGAGLAYLQKMPDTPLSNNTPRALLMNAAIYRRTMQVAVLEFDKALSSHTAPTVLSTPSVPYEPSRDTTHTWDRLGWATIVGIIAVICVSADRWTIEFFAPVILAIMWIDIWRLISHPFKLRQYDEQVWKANRAAKIVRAKNARAASQAQQIRTVLGQAEHVLRSTIPPAVPRAFSGNLLTYTQK